MLIHETMRKSNSQRHKLRSFVTGEAEHHPLITGAVFINTLRNMRALGMDVTINLNSGIRKADIRVGIANLSHYFADKLINRCTGKRSFRGNFTRYNGEVGRYERFAGNAAGWVVCKAEVKHSIADLIGHFVRVAHGD
jgi:hypothetical protein